MAFSSNSDEVKVTVAVAKPTKSSGSSGGVGGDEVKAIVAVAKPPTSSGSSGGGRGGGGGGEEEKKRRRKDSNRESARRSRQRKQDHLDGLLKQIGILTRENKEYETTIRDHTAVFTAVDEQNGMLKAEKDRLAAKLDELENIIDIAKVVRGSSSSSGNGGDVVFNYEMNDHPMMKPWQMPCYSLPIMASSGNLRFNFNA